MPIIPNGTYVEIERPKPWRHASKTLRGRVTFQNEYYFAVRVEAGYCECVLFADLKTGYAKILKGGVAA